MEFDTINHIHRLEYHFQVLEVPHLRYASHLGSLLLLLDLSILEASVVHLCLFEDFVMSINMCIRIY